MNTNDAGLGREKTSPLGTAAPRNTPDNLEEEKEEEEQDTETPQAQEEEKGTETPQAPQSREQKKASKLEMLEQRRNKIEEQIKALQAKEKEKERRERTRRLIQIGAIACKYLNCPDDIEPKDFEARMKQVVEVPEVKNMLKRG